MRKDLAEFYCHLSPEDCSKKLETQFENNFLTACQEGDFASDCSKVNPFIRPWVYCTGVAEGGHMEFERIYKLYTKEVNAAEKKRLLEALTCSRDPRNLRRLLHEVVHSEKSAIPKADVQSLVESMNSQPVGAEIVSDFVLDNWKDLVERFSLDKATLSDIVRNSVRLDSERDVKQAIRAIYRRSQINDSWTASPETATGKSQESSTMAKNEQKDDEGPPQLTSL
ncbi:hypothetical protein OESDEN_18988 [Oesophagostomum dentatum]|uniref:ERAP1-like C-terminal domain-containing protein n=1 Tax=Oesophagostomum dentatum TaxID=61180 RepID=A0A0B1SBQ5_OESDE|nr:hypothetical protein OESDEN_18988 [Oesophagostomum dentatum]